MNEVNVDVAYGWTKKRIRTSEGEIMSVLVCPNCSRWTYECIDYKARPKGAKFKINCNLEHYYVYGSNTLEAILYLLHISNNIMQLFLSRRLKRRYETQREMVRVLFKGLYLLKYRDDLIFNSS